MRDVTAKQRAILQFIYDFRSRHFVAPSFQQIADGFGISKGTLADQIDALILKGMLTRDGKRNARTLALTTWGMTEITIPPPLTIPLWGRLSSRGILPV